MVDRDQKGILHAIPNQELSLRRERHMANAMPPKTNKAKVDGSGTMV
jgi:hypothetical protein